MKKSVLFVAVALCFSGSALAQQSTASSVANHGDISNTVKSFASSNGAGTSYSAATNTERAASGGYAVTTSGRSADGTVYTGSGAVGGKSVTSSEGTAYNVSTGRGTGSASSVGASDPDVTAKADYSGPSQWIGIHGNSDSGMQDRDLNGTNVSITAGRNQGGYSTASSMGEFTGVGAVGSVVKTTDTIVGNVTVTTTFKATGGFVNDSKLTNSQVQNGAMVVNGHQLTQAPVTSQAGTVINAGGAFGDPI